MLSAFSFRRCMTYQRHFIKSLSMRGSLSYLTEDNIMIGNDSLSYPEGDVFSEFVKMYEKYGDKKAMVDGMTGQSLTYSELVKNSRKFGSFLDSKGYKEGDRVCIHTPNCIEYSYTLMGTLANGMVFNTANPLYTSYEINTQLNSSKPKVLITNTSLLDVAKQAVENTETELLINVDDLAVNDSGVINLSDILLNGDENFSKELSIDPKNDTALLLYSSGTTGLPKGVMITHEVLTRNVLQIKNALGSMMAKRLLCVLPLYHIYGLLPVMLLTIHHGDTLYTLPSFEPQTFLKCIETYKIDRIPMVPPIALFLMNNPMVNDYDLSSVNSLLVGAAPMDEAATSIFKEKFPSITLQQGYGMTEAAITHMQPNDESLHKPGSCGQVFADIECKVISLESGEALPPFEHGEVCIKGKQIMKGYFENPEATSNTIDEHGWLHTGDLGYYDNECNLFVIDRLKELIKYKGYQVAPAELEDLLISHPDIEDSCVIGIPCERAGEIPRAFIVTKNSTLTEEEVQRFVSEKLSNHKWLRGGVKFVDGLPKSASGKLLRRVLKEEYLKELK